MSIRKFRFDVEIKGYITVEVTAASRASALRKAQDRVDKELLGTLVADLSSKSHTMQLVYDSDQEL
jgi:hypothetical protein